MDAIEIYTRHIQINHRPKRPLKSVAESFAVGFEPSPDASSESGNLYLLFEYNDGDKRINLDKFLDGCGKAFYESGIETGFDNRFKLCLRFVNELISSSKSTCNIGLVAIVANEMLFANVGELTMIHSRKGSATSLTTDSSENKFREVGSGKVRPGDSILLTSRAVTASLTQSELGKIISDQPIEQSSQDITKNLQLPEAVPYSVLLVQAEKSPIPKDLLRQRPDDIPKQAQAKINSILVSFQGHTKRGGQKIKHGLKQSASNTKTKVVPAVLSKSKHGWTKFWSKYINPNPKQAFIIVIISTLIIIGVFLGFSSVYSSTNASKELDDAGTLISSAQASLSKNNTKSAQESIDKAHDILSKISKSDQDKLNQLAQSNKIKRGYSDISSDLANVEDKITGTTRIKLADGFGIEQSKLVAMIWVDNSLYGLDAVSGSILAINPLLGAPAIKATDKDLIGAKALTNQGDTGLIAIGSSNLWQYNPANGLQSLRTDPGGAVDIESYLSNLYLLVPSESQIVRYIKSGLSLSSKADILKSPSTGGLAKASSLMINGNIFVTQSNKIKLFEQGTESSYDTNGLPDSFGDIKDSYFDLESGYFILLNKDLNKLAMLTISSDSANFVRFYALEGNAPIYSFSIEPKSGQLFINTDKKIVTYKIQK